MPHLRDSAPREYPRTQLPPDRAPKGPVSVPVIPTARNLPLGGACEEVGRQPDRPDALELLDLDQQRPGSALSSARNPAPPPTASPAGSLTRCASRSAARPESRSTVRTVNSASCPAWAVPSTRSIRELPGGSIRSPVRSRARTWRPRSSARKSKAARRSSLTAHPRPRRAHPRTPGSAPRPEARSDNRGS